MWLLFLKMGFGKILDIPGGYIQSFQYDVPDNEVSTISLADLYKRSGI